MRAGVIVVASAAASRCARTLMDATSECENPSASSVLAVSIPKANLSAQALNLG